MVLAILTSIAAVVCAIVFMVSDKIDVRGISLALFLAFVFALIGLAIFTFTDIKGDYSDANFGWAYVLGWFGRCCSSCRWGYSRRVQPIGY